MSGYRPPNTNATKFLKEYKEAVSTWTKQKHHDLVIGLDHNMDFLKSEKHQQTQRVPRIKLRQRPETDDYKTN